MGRKAKLSRERSTKTFSLTPEMAEVFDQQMDSDREWFEASALDCVRFRPEIEGEWSQYFVVGGTPPSLPAFQNRQTGEVAPFNWTCVVDVGWALRGHGPATGMRTRLMSPPPYPEIRQFLAQFAVEYVKAFIEALQEQAAAAR